MVPSIYNMGYWGFNVQEQGWRKGPWTPEEDKLLSEYVNLHGEGRWSSVARCAGLNRSGKSCRLRWVNYLRPGLKRGQITPQEEGIIIELHALWGNKWSTIARYLPGRTDNEIKNFWRTQFKKKEKSSLKQQKRRSQILKDKLQKQDQLIQAQQENTSTKTTEALEGKMNINDHHQPHQITKALYDTFFADTPSDHNIADVNGLDHHQQCFPVMYQDLVWSDATPDHDFVLWGGLWNLDDPFAGRTDSTSQYYMSKVAVSQNNNNNNNNQAAGHVNYQYGSVADNNCSNKNGNNNIIPIQNQARAFSSCGGSYIF